MTTHRHPPTPPPQDPMPLDAEERALATRLARLGPHGEPSPALDARVLATAHAATSGAARAGSRGERGWRRARWPIGVGAAASVALAAGIAWQMRLLPAPVFPPAEMAASATAPAAVDRADTAAAAKVATPVRTLSTPAPTPAPTSMTDVATPSDATAAAAVAAVAAATVAAAPASTAATRDAAATKALAPPPPEAPAIVFDAPAPIAAAAPPAPPPPPAKSATQAQSRDALPVFDADDMDAPEADVPPATAASPQVRDAWLARIRELAAGGRNDEARASLAEFRRRYPAFAIPDDLRPLLPPTPAQAPMQAPTQTPAPASAPAPAPSQTPPSR